jgi:O-6-methylguanine DNA methyltransferase
MLSSSNFKERVLQVVRDIPMGETMSYKEVAIRSQASGASRAVGTIMKNNFDNTVSCHRVVSSDGSVGQYNRGGKEAKIKILKKEGVKFTNKNKIICDII